RVRSAGILPAGRAASCRPSCARRLEAAAPAAWKAALPRSSLPCSSLPRSERRHPAGWKGGILPPCARAARTVSSEPRPNPAPIVETGFLGIVEDVADGVVVVAGVANDAVVVFALP